MIMLVVYSAQYFYRWCFWVLKRKIVLFWPMYLKGSMSTSLIVSGTEVFYSNFPGGLGGGGGQWVDVVDRWLVSYLVFSAVYVVCDKLNIGISSRLIAFSFFQKLLQLLSHLF